MPHWILNSTNKPFSKPNNEISYIHKESNHPPSVIKQVPFSIESRLSSLSWSEKIFNEYTPIYQEAPKKSGYDYKLKYQKITSTTNSKQQRKRNIICFNPPYSMNVATNVGRFFLNLINKHFPPQHKFSKIFNRNNMKISYSCMPNMKSRINIHNKKVTKAKPSAQARTCNCINKSKCPLNNKCLSNNVLYKANITSTSENYRNKIYYSISETKFNWRYANHRKSFKNRNYKTDTELSNEIWKLKEQNKSTDISWEILGIHQSDNTSTKRCMSCLNERLAITLHKEDNILNKRTEIISKCRHSIKYNLANYDTKD